MNRLLFVLVSFMLIHPMLLADEVKLVVGEYAPYINSKNTNKGFMSEIVVKAFKMVGVKASFKIVPWKRVEMEIDKKDGVSYAYIHNRERGKKWHFSTTIMSAPTVFIVRKDTNFSWKSFEDLKNYKIGISRGYSYGESFDNLRKSKDYSIEIANRDDLNIKKVLFKRIHLFPVDPFVGAEIIRTKLKPEQAKQLIAYTNVPLSNDPMFLVCSKKSKKCKSTIKSFNTGLAKLTENGEKKRILDRSMSLE